MGEIPEFLASPEQAYPVGMPIAVHARNAPERPAVLSDRGNLTFAELNARANRLVRALRERGLRAGDSVALMSSNRPEFVEVFAAALRSGVRLTLVNWHLQADELAYIIEDCEATVLIAEDRVAAVATEVAAKRPGSLIKLAIGGAIPGFEAYEKALEAHSGADISDPSLGRTMQYTSGTTGRPKGVRHPSRPTTPPASAVTTTSRMIGGESLVLCTGPLYHAAPLTYNMAIPLYYGVGIALMDRWDAEDALRMIERHRCSHTHMVATMFHRMLALPPDVKQRYDVSSMRHILHGAAPTPVHVKRAMMEWFGPVIYEYYAGTEGGGTMIGPDEWLLKPGSVGRAVPGRSVAIFDDAGVRLGPGQVGRVFFKTPEGGRFEYFKAPEKTAAAYHAGHFTLGDHGYVDEDGYLFLTGRTSELIISGGVNIYPAEVDDVLLMHPSVADVAAVGVPNDEFGEEVKAVVVPAPGYAPSPALAAELIEFCRARLAHFKCPRSVDFVDSVPRSEAGKVYRRRVRERYWEGRGRAL